MQREKMANKFFGSESLSTKFSETFSENYQQTEGINFPNYETHKADGYQDLSGTVDCNYADRRKKKKKKGKQ
ncbi:jg6524 [Pararge aegeria aegeria]|uniref:Jg6524 protein n=1 Tax=Pararge aegeria aegeria TaxID=348720 RepID=A0A8S4S618_9NEOP|nr:jg6524 [Pararge aegeria aegeria]